MHQNRGWNQNPNQNRNQSQNNNQQMMRGGPGGAPGGAMRGGRSDRGPPQVGFLNEISRCFKTKLNLQFAILSPSFSRDTVSNKDKVMNSVE